MSAAVPFIVAGIAGFGASKIVTKITGSSTLGMIAGIAAGGFAGMAASAPAGAAGGSGGAGAGTASGASGASAGGALTNYMPLPTSPAGITTGTGGGLLSGAAPTITPAATTAGVTSGAAGSIPGATVAGAATPVGMSGLLSKVGLTPTDAWNIGGNIAKGYGDFKMKGRELDIYEDREQLARDAFNQDKLEREEETAYGVTRAGGGAPLNVQQQLDQVNKGSAMTGLNNLNTVQRPEAGYLSGYGRFMKEEEKVA